MSTKNVLVTGASGFIGRYLVARLIARGDNVTCLVRRTSDIAALEKFDCTIVYGDTVKDPDAIATAVAGIDAVYHLAASTHTVRSPELLTLNTTGFENLLNACADCPSPPTVVFVSSLAAAGPSRKNCPLVENDPVRPVSFYGRSKAECEKMALKYSSQLPISIVRPPVVLGGGDRLGFEMFQTIDQYGWHFVPSLFPTRNVSVIHVEDLATALVEVADRGRRLSPKSKSEGIYFASADEVYTYSILGRQIGKALGSKRTRVVRVAMPIVWTIGSVNELIARLLSKPQFLNYDKFREINAGSWTCSNEKIKQETGFAPSMPMPERLKQTANWYRQQGWLDEKKIASSATPSPQISGAGQHLRSDQ